MRCLLNDRISSCTMSSKCSIFRPTTLTNGFASGSPQSQFCVQLSERETLLCYAVNCNHSRSHYCERFCVRCSNMLQNWIASSRNRNIANGFAHATLLCYAQIASSRNRKHCESLSLNFANVVFMLQNVLRTVVNCS